MRFTPVIPMLAFGLMLGGCATTGERTAGDPLEGFNRGVWAVNRGADQVIIKPVSTVYRTVTPRPARRGISRLFANLTEPWSFINNILQGKPGRAMNNLGRFVVNTTLGVGGLADHATGLGIAPANEDFGQTLATWGVKSSSYLVLPLLGPSTIRDGIGSGVGFFADPIRIAQEEAGFTGTEKLAVSAAQVIVTRADLTEAGADSFLDASLDPYAAARSAYLQRRSADILDQPLDAEPTGDDDFRIELDPSGADAGGLPDATTAPAPEVETAPAAPETPETGASEAPESPQ